MCCVYDINFTKKAYILPDNYDVFELDDIGGGKNVFNNKATLLPKAL